MPDLRRSKSDLAIQEEGHGTSSAIPLSLGGNASQVTPEKTRRIRIHRVAMSPYRRTRPHPSPFRGGGTARRAVGGVGPQHPHHPCRPPRPPPDQGLPRGRRQGADGGPRRRATIRSATCGCAPASPAPRSSASPMAMPSAPSASTGAMRCGRRAGLAAGAHAIACRSSMSPPMAMSRASRISPCRPCRSASTWSTTTAICICR